MSSGTIDRRHFIAGLALAGCLVPDRASAQPSQFSAAVAAARTIAEGAVKLAELFEGFVRIGYRLEDLVNRREEEEKLRDLYDRLGRLQQRQETLIGYWPERVGAPPSAAAWRGWREHIIDTRGVVQQTGRAVEAYRGSFSYRPEFRQLRQAIARRGVLLDFLQRMIRPTTPANLRRLNAIRGEYGRLIGQLERLADAMGNFLAAIERG